MTELESCHTVTQLPAAAGRVSHRGRTLGELLISSILDSALFVFPQALLSQ